ncbi:L-rhamnose mutarotase [Flavobacterium sp. MAHUQ-51]|uniref:L-rhamnose mutarotase n=1 Tax=Flavobacterium sp. GCM10022190 TaxID=3252639 RepID=UPI00360E621F
MRTQKYCFALDLKEDLEMIEEYKMYHLEVWPEIIESIKASGIELLDIYNVGNRMFMIIETNKDFSFERKSEMDANNPKVQEWEKLMWKYQKALPFAKSGEKWILMDKIFELK